MTVKNTVISWNNTALDVLRATGVRPPEASRAMATIHVAMHDATGWAERTHRVRRDRSLKSRCVWEKTACAIAAHVVLTRLFPEQSRFLDVALGASLPGGLPSDLGVTLGQSSAEAVLQWRENDHSDDVVPYVPLDRPGTWRPTPPDYEDAHAPHWPMVTPFATSSSSQFHSAGHPGITSPEYASALDKTKRLGGKNSRARTDDQTQIAHFWADGAGTVILWNLVAQQVLLSEDRSLSDAARLLALLNAALADAVTSAWHDKFHFNLWRPVTAIREAHLDGNPLTEADPTWEPLCATTPEPEHTSAHCAVSGAASQILRLFLGRDIVPFSLTSVKPPEISRSFRSFSEAAREAADSRIYAGLHFEFSTSSGLAKGRYIADHVWRYLRPLREKESLKC